MSLLIPLSLSVLFLGLAAALIMSRMNLKISLPKRQKAPEAPAKNVDHGTTPPHQEKKHEKAHAPKGHGNHHGYPLWLVGLALIGLLFLGFVAYKAFGVDKALRNTVESAGHGVAGIFLNTSEPKKLVKKRSDTTLSSNCGRYASGLYSLRPKPGEVETVPVRPGQRLCYESDTLKQVEAGTITVWCIHEDGTESQAKPFCTSVQRQLRFARASDEAPTILFRFTPTE